jgi:putative ABC transport system ATP-binding protein
MRGAAVNASRAGGRVVVQTVSKSYRLGETTVVALHRVSVEANPGEFVALVGPSGSGKTTLLHLIGGLDDPDAGQVSVDGRRVGMLSRRARADLRATRIGFVFQFFSLLPVLTAYENVEYPLLFHPLPTAERRERVTAILERVGLASHARHRPDQLSGGQQQRVAIARALVTGAGLILADEPTANLDSATGRSVVDLIEELRRERGATFVLATHDESLLARASHVVRLRDGRRVPP